MRKRGCLGGLLLVVTLLGVAALWMQIPYARFGGEAIVDIPRGTGTRAIAELLAGAGVIQNPLQFWVVRAVRPGVRLKAGEYRFDRPANAWRVFDRIARGDVFYYSLPVPEGNTSFDIAAALEREHAIPAREFLAAVREPKAIREIDARAPSLEGYLFPDTYRITHQTTPEQLCRMMTDRFREAWKQLGEPKADLHVAVTMASMVEKEARLPSERPVIASVYYNRLRVGLPLQCDPTTIYAALLEDRYRGAIYRSDLASQQLYNTYQHAGLPPGPIANPGLESLRAALNPAETDFLYFVLRPDGSGSHQFSKTLAEHERAVQQYRRGLRKAEQESRSGRVPGTKAPGGGDRGRIGRASGAARTGLR